MTESHTSSQNNSHSSIEKLTTTPKSKEFLQAQLAAFITETITNSDDRSYLFNQLTELSESDLTDIMRTVGPNEFIRHESGALEQLQEGMLKTSATKDEFLAFLRSHSGSNYEAIRGRAEILEAFPQFIPAVNQLKTELVGLTNHSDHPTFLGKGSNAHVFAVIVEDKKYAIRIPIKRSPGYQTTWGIDHHLSGAFLGKDLPHMEQIIAASYDDGVTVAEMIPGKELGNLNAREIESITEEHLHDFVSTLTTAQQKGIKIDPKPSNIFYEVGNGFGIVDYTSDKVGFSSGKETLENVIRYIDTDITNMGLYGKPYTRLTTESAARDLEIYKAQMVCLKRFQKVLEATEFSIVKASVQKSIKARTELIQHYSDPAWIVEQIEEEELRLQKKTDWGWKQVEI